jgi:hypothetical protein
MLEQMMDDAALGELSTRELQAYGALCLANFCGAAGIRHRVIAELIVHLVSLLSADKLPDWEVAAARLHLAGDALPSDVVRDVPANLIADFNAMVESAIEIGVIDMYGAPTQMPRRFALRCREILDKHGYEAPSASDVMIQTRPLEGPWGRPASDEASGRVHAACLRQLDDRRG